jgi:hypothetical protein
VSEAESDSDNDEPSAIDSGSSRQFASGLEVGLQDIARVMRSRYTRVVGVLGQADAGKTCLFTSIYLQLTSRQLLPKYRFAGSDTLQGFEQRARHLRDWSQGEIPERIVDRTHFGNPRAPAFLHIAVQDSLGIRQEFLFPDLPGEWTTRLLSDASTASRFAFLQRSDVVLIVLEAPQFAERRSRNVAITDATHLAARLAEEIKLPQSIPVVLAVTKCDQTNGKTPAEVERVVNELSTRGYHVKAVPLAAFPRDGTPPGYGIAELMDQMSASVLQTEISAATLEQSTTRSYLSTRGRR